MKMFDRCKASGVIVKKKLKFLQRYARSDSIVCLACNESRYLVIDLSLSVCVSVSVTGFGRFLFFKILLPFKIKK